MVNSTFVFSSSLEVGCLILCLLCVFYSMWYVLSKVLLSKWLVNEGMGILYPGKDVSVLFDEKLSDGICIILHLKSLSSLIKCTLSLLCC